MARVLRANGEGFFPFVSPLANLILIPSDRYTLTSATSLSLIHCHYFTPGRAVCSRCCSSLKILDTRSKSQLENALASLIQLQVKWQATREPRADLQDEMNARRNKSKQLPVQEKLQYTFLAECSCKKKHEIAREKEHLLLFVLHFMSSQVNHWILKSKAH